MAPRPPHPVVSALLFFALFFGFYVTVGEALAPSRLYGRADLVLGTDVPRVIADLTRFEANHYRTKVHPLFVILLNPLGLLLKQLIGTPRLAAIALSSAFAALGGALFHELLRRFGVGAPRAALWTLLFGLSASQLFFGAVPETYAFSGASLLVLFVLFAAGHATGWRLVAAGVFSFGMTVTNLVVAVWLRARALGGSGGPWALIPRLLRYTLAVVGITTALAALQAWHYPRAKLFFGPAALQEETQYAFLPGSLRDLGRRAADLGANAALFNLAAPTLRVDKRGQRHPKTSFAHPSAGALRPAGAVHAVLWLALLAMAGVWAARQRLDREPQARALLGCLVFELALHFLYGETLFLYSCHWTFATLGLAALAVEHWQGARPGRALPTAAALATLITLQAANNWAFLSELRSIYR